MTTYAYPATRAFAPATWEWGLRANVIVSQSPLNGATTTYEVPGARWRAVLRYPQSMHVDRAAVEAFWASVRGQANRVSLWHIGRPVIRGTAVSATVAASALASTITVSGTNGQTLLAGDMVGLGSSGQLVMVTADATIASGTATVAVSPPVRAAVSGGTTLVTTRPTALFMVDPSAESPLIAYSPGLSDTFSVALIEALA